MMSRNSIMVDPGDPQALALESGSRTFNGPRQIYIPPTLLLGPNQGGESGAATYFIRVPTPDSRCRVKLSIVFFSTGAPGTDAGGTIWIAACEQDQKGVSGSSGKTAPVTNVEGTQAAPTAFPAAGLQGYSREFVTAADCLEATIAISSGQNTPGYWVLQTRIQPDSVTLGWEEWDQIRRLFLPQRTG
jgi:hypothetical protein